MLDVTVPATSAHLGVAQIRYAQDENQVIDKNHF